MASIRDLEQGRVSAPRPETLRLLAASLGLSAEETTEFTRRARAKETRGRTLWLQVLGPLSVEAGGTQVDIASTRQRLLLGLLALSPGVALSRDYLIEIAWGAHPPSNAVNLLQTNISRLRRQLAQHGPAGTQFLVTARGGYRLAVTDEQLDLLHFRQLVARARRHRHEDDPAGASRLFRQALDLWRGEPLADLQTLQVHPDITALQNEWSRAVLSYAEAATCAGIYREVLPLLWELVDRRPLNEEAHARLMIALAGSGQQAAALSQFDKLRARLDSELGADPGHEVVQAHQRVLRQDIPHSDDIKPVTVSAHRQLPHDITDFTGREAELRLLCEARPDGEENATTRISVITGMAGVGKTRLALRAAHRLVAAQRYADARLYVDLRGHADCSPTDPATVLTSFLRLLGVSGEQIPQDVQERSALYRRQLDGQNALILLDNAANEEQIRPLLPTSPTNLALITSRRTLNVDGARELRLDVFRTSEAEALLSRIVGRDRVKADTEAARAVVDLCGRLPLAVALAARRMQARPAWGFGDLAARLRAAADRTGELEAGTRRTRAAFDLSYRALDQHAARCFRLLGIHPGTTCTPTSVAVLTGSTIASAERTLAGLARENLVIPVTHDRYRLHDLIREYARDLAGRDEQQDSTTGLKRLVRWYVHAARAAYERSMPNKLGLPDYGDQTPPYLPNLTTDDEASEWYSAEHETLLACVSCAVELGQLRLAWQLPLLLRPHFERSNNIAAWIRVATIGLDAARRADDRHGRALLLGDLGVAYGVAGNLDRSVESLLDSLELRRATGDLDGQSWCLNNLGIAKAMRGELAEAVDHLHQAYELAREFHDRTFEGRILSNLGKAYAALGEHESASRYFRLSLQVRSRSEDPVGIGITLCAFGEAKVKSGEAGEAIPLLREALELHRSRRAYTYEIEAAEALAGALEDSQQEAEADEIRLRAKEIREKYLGTM